MLKIEPTNRHDIQCSGHFKMLKLRPCSLQSSSKNVSIFNERERSICRNHWSQSLQGSWIWKVPCVYRLYGPNVYVDKMKALVVSLLADGHYNQCNGDFAQ